MAIIRDFYNENNTHIRIDDTYMVKTKEENDEILRNIAKIWTEADLKRLMQENTEKSEPA